MSKAYPSNLTRDQYEFLSDLIPEAKPGGRPRTEADFLAHIQQTVATDPEGVWIFITDQLNIHQSESLVKWVAEVCQTTLPLGSQTGD